MVSLNYDYLEKLIAESKMNQSQLALEMGLPEKFFTRLKYNGSNLSVEELCIIVDYFGVDVNELLTMKTANDKSKIDKGKKLFAKFYEYEEKVLSMPPPDVEAYKSSWVTDVGSYRTYTGSPEQIYVEKKNEYKRNAEIYSSMENVLISIVSNEDCPLYDKRLLRNDIVEHLVYGVRSSSTKLPFRRVISLSNKACMELINELEYKNLM